MNVWETVLGNRTLESINSMAHSLDKIKENQPTLRDQFAMAALQGLLSCESTNGNHELFAKQAYAYADAMLEVRKEK